MARVNLGARHLPAVTSTNDTNRAAIDAAVSKIMPQTHANGEAVAVMDHGKIGDVLADLKRRWRAESRRQRRELAGFRKRLYDRWKAPLEGLRMMLTMSRELGDSVNQEIRQSPDAASRRHLIDQLARSHARACQIVEEILCLLEGGFSDGALARWRTLHGSGPSCGTTSCATTAVLWPQGRGSTPYATEPPECAPARRRWNPVPRRETAQADRRVHRSPVRDR
jgi:hypothetical protein